MEQLKRALAVQGYSNFKVFNGSLAGINQYLFTTGICLGLTEDGLFGRYCYENHEDAVKALDEWDGAGHPPGNWIVYKGYDRGFGEQCYQKDVGE